MRRILGKDATTTKLDWPSPYTACLPRLQHPFEQSGAGLKKHIMHPGNDRLRPNTRTTAPRLSIMPLLLSPVLVRPIEGPQVERGVGGDQHASDAQDARERPLSLLRCSDVEDKTLDGWP